jgi:hypothetical protein
VPLNIQDQRNSPISTLDEAKANDYMNRGWVLLALDRVGTTTDLPPAQLVSSQSEYVLGHFEENAL